MRAGSVPQTAPLSPWRPKSCLTPPRISAAPPHIGRITRSFRKHPVTERQLVLSLAETGVPLMKRLSEVAFQLRSRPLERAVQDTAAGCHALAAADLARASLMDTVNGRRRLETSALSWRNRAESIQRMDAARPAQQAIARAEWEDGEAVSRGQMYMSRRPS